MDVDEDVVRCSEKSSSEPAPRAISHRLAAARAAAALPELRRRRSPESDTAAGGEGQCRKWLWGLGRVLGFGMALRRACCARRVWNSGSLFAIAMSAYLSSLMLSSAAPATDSLTSGGSCLWWLRLRVGNEDRWLDRPGQRPHQCYATMARRKREKMNAAPNLPATIHPWMC